MTRQNLWRVWVTRSSVSTLGHGSVVPGGQRLRHRQSQRRAESFGGLWDVV